jgi:hypothetical protein
MSRRSCYLIRFCLTLGGLVLPGGSVLLAVQAPPPVAWVVTVGDSIYYGHTEYHDTVAVVERIVYDSVARRDSLRTVDSVRVAWRLPVGLAAGLSAWPAERYCDGPASGTVQPLEPRELVGRLQLAAKCGVRLVIVPPRRLLTTNGRTAGLFSVDSARRLMERYAAAAPADTISKYRPWIVGLNLGDDYACAKCWGGQPITQLQVTAWAGHARRVLPAVPLGVRVTPDWVARYPALAPLLDYAWAQYQARKGDAAKYWDGAAADAARLGLRLVMGINVEDCGGPGTAACSAAELLRLGTMAVGHPASCAFLSWRYDEGTWANVEVRAVWEGLVAVARGRGVGECGRGVGREG